MKILTDEDFGLFIVERLRSLFGSEAEIVRVAELELESTPNGDLLLLASTGGYDFMLTCDKRMADSEVPLLPVLIIDKVKRVEVARADATARALAARLLGDPPLYPGYYGVPVEGYKTSPRLARIMEGRHRMHADRVAERMRWARRSAQAAGRPNGVQSGSNE